MNDLLWFLTRATGIVAVALIATSVVSGFLFSARETAGRKPAWWLDLHNMLGGLALIFTVAHIVFSLADRDLGITLAEVFVPGVADFDRWPLAWGVLATYLVTTAVLTSWPRRRFRRRTWRVIHLGSVLGMVLAIAHMLQLGTDAGSSWVRAGLVLVVGVSAYSLGVRAFGLVFRQTDDSQPTLR